MLRKDFYECREVRISTAGAFETGYHIVERGAQPIFVRKSSVESVMLIEYADNSADIVLTLGNGRHYVVVNIKETNDLFDELMR